MRSGSLVGTPCQTTQQKGRWRPARRKPPIPRKGFIGPGPATARRDPDRPVVRPRDQNAGARFIGPGPATARRDPDRPVVRPQDQGPGARCRHTHVLQTEEGLRNPHSVTRPSAPSTLFTLAWKPATPEATKPLQTHGSRGRTPAQSAMINIGGGSRLDPTPKTTRYQPATAARGPTRRRRAI